MDYFVLFLTRNMQETLAYSDFLFAFPILDYLPCYLWRSRLDVLQRTYLMAEDHEKPHKLICEPSLFRIVCFEYLNMRVLHFSLTYTSNRTLVAAQLFLRLH